MNKVNFVTWKSFVSSGLNWKTVAEFKSNYDRRLSEAEKEFQNMSADWETKINRAKEEFQNEVSTLISNHSLQLNNYRELHEAALENLEREKCQIIEGRMLLFCTKSIRGYRLNSCDCC